MDAKSLPKMKCMASVVSLHDVEQVTVTYFNSFIIAYTFFCARESNVFVGSSRNIKHTKPFFPTKILCHICVRNFVLAVLFNKCSLQPIFLLILD